jgi:hypothetical protein
LRRRARQGLLRTIEGEDGVPRHVNVDDSGMEQRHTSPRCKKATE